MKTISLLFALAILIFSLEVEAHKLPPAVQKIVDEVKALQGDVNRGETLSVTCTSCHGLNGVPVASRESDVPFIADQTPVYLAIQMAMFKTGHRNNPTMKTFAEKLTSQDMADLIAFYQSQDIREAHCEDSPRGRPLSTSSAHLKVETRTLIKEINSRQGTFAAGKLMAEKEREFTRGDGSTVKISCTMCHGENGMMDDQYREGTMHPDLAALGKGYIVHQLAAYKTGDRTGGPMTIMTRDLTAQDLADLAAYYSQITHCR